MCRTRPVASARGGFFLRSWCYSQSRVVRPPIIKYLALSVGGLIRLGRNPVASGCDPIP